MGGVLAVGRGGARRPVGGLLRLRAVVEACSSFGRAERSGSRRGAWRNLSSSINRRIAPVRAASSASVRSIVGRGEWDFTSMSVLAGEARNCAKPACSVREAQGEQGSGRSAPSRDRALTARKRAVGIAARTPRASEWPAVGQRLPSWKVAPPGTWFQSGKDHGRHAINVVTVRTRPSVGCA
jgi:hypothetical protein